MPHELQGISNDDDLIQTSKNISYFICLYLASSERHWVRHRFGIQLLTFSGHLTFVSAHLNDVLLVMSSFSGIAFHRTYSEYGTGACRQNEGKGRSIYCIAFKVWTVFFYFKICCDFVRYLCFNIYFLSRVRSPVSLLMKPLSCIGSYLKLVHFWADQNLHRQFYPSIIRYYQVWALSDLMYLWADMNLTC